MNPRWLLPRRLLGLVAIQLVLSGFATDQLTRNLEGRQGLILAHLALVSAAWLLLLGLLGALIQIGVVRRGSWSGRLYGFPHLLLFLSLAGVYAIDALALGHWGHTVTFALLWQSVDNLPNLFALAPLRSVVAIGTGLAVLALSWRVGPGVREEVASLFARRAPLLLCLVLLLAAGLVRAGGGHLASRPDLWNREPLASLLGLEMPRPELAASDVPNAGEDYPKVATARRANVVLIVADALRATSMGVYDYSRPTTPFLTELWREGAAARVDMALATCSQSQCGVASLLGSREAFALPVTGLRLQDVLHAQGYRNTFLLSGAHLEWHDLTDLFGPHIDSLRDDPTNDDANLLRWLRELPDATEDEPRFFYLHLMSSHWFGLQLRDYQRYQPTARRFDWLYDVKRVLAGGVDDELRQHVINRYDNSVLQADAYVRRIFEALREKGYLDDALWVVTSDHGEALGERGPDHYGHGHGLYQELIRVPMLLGDTAQGGGSPFGSVGFASQADVAPTLLQRLGLPVPAEWEGRPLIGAEMQRYSFHASEVPAAGSRSGSDERVLGVVSRAPDGRMHKLLRFERREAGRWNLERREFFDLSSDPEERRNLLRVGASSAAPQLADLERRLERRFDATDSGNGPGRALDARAGLSTPR